MIPHRYDIDKLINKIPIKFYKDFIRGIVDAEGSIIDKIIYYKSSICKEFSLSITTYENLLLFINKIFIQEKLTETTYKLTKRHEDKDEYCKQLRITGNNVVINILNWLYKDTENLSLIRKYKKYIEILNYKKIKI